jgi:hypothetical protein
VTGGRKQGRQPRELTAERSMALAALSALASLRLGGGVLEGGPRVRLLATMALLWLALATNEEAAALARVRARLP